MAFYFRLSRDSSTQIGKFILSEGLSLPVEHGRFSELENLPVLL